MVGDGCYADEHEKFEHDFGCGRLLLSERCLAERLRMEGGDKSALNNTS